MIHKSAQKQWEILRTLRNFTGHYAWNNKIKNLWDYRLGFFHWLLFWLCISLGKLILFYYSHILVMVARYMKITVWGTHLPYWNSHWIYNSDSFFYFTIVWMCIYMCNFLRESNYNLLKCTYFPIAFLLKHHGHSMHCSIIVLWESEELNAFHSA